MEVSKIKVLKCFPLLIIAIVSFTLIVITVSIACSDIIPDMQSYIKRSEEKQPEVKPEEKQPEVKPEEKQPEVKPETKPVESKPIPPVLKVKKCKGKVKTYTAGNLGEQYDEYEVRRHPNLPDVLTEPKKINKLIPSISSIRWTGKVYQESWNESPKFFLYSAYFDARLKTGLIVRILSMYDDDEVTLDFFCQFWYGETERPVMSIVYESYFAGELPRGKGALRPNMMACKVPSNKKEKRMPIMVSVVRKQCSSSSNILKINGSPNKEKENLENSKHNTTIGLCGNVLHGYSEDISVRLMEWIELLKILGVSRIFLYKTSCHKNVERILEYYEKEGVVQLLSFYYPPPLIQEGALLSLVSKEERSSYDSAQLVAYNDCILRNKDYFDYLAVLDYNEVPILKKHQNLADLFQHLKNSSDKETQIAGYELQRKLFYSDLKPKHKKKVSGNLYILRHNQRTSLNTIQHNENVSKSIYDSNRVLFVTSQKSIEHEAVEPISTKLQTLEKSIAYIGYFGDEICDAECKKQKMEEENTLLQYQKKLLTQIITVLDATEKGK